MKLSKFWICAVFCLNLVPAGTSHASIVINITESGPNVIATAFGTANTAGLSISLTGSTTAYLGPIFADVFIGPPSIMPTFFYASLSGPANFGSSSVTFASSGTGQRFGINRSSNRLILPSGYVSGSMLSGGSTWSGHSFASLGLTPGTYNYTWGSGGNADSLQLNIIPSNVPEPGAFLLSGVALVAAWGVRKFRVRKRASAGALLED